MSFPRRKARPVSERVRQGVKYSAQVVDLFAEDQKAELVPVSPEQEAGTVRRHAPAPSAHTRAVSPQTSMVASLPVTSVASKTVVQLKDATRVPLAPRISKTSRREKRNTIFLGIALLALALVTGIEGLRQGGQEVRPGKSYDMRKFKDDVEFHRRVTGSKLNSDRIAVQYENDMRAPPLPLSAGPQVKPNDLAGVPLAAESRPHAFSRDRLEPVNPNAPDAQAMYSLQEEQDQRLWADRARAEYIREFIANAKAAGYNVVLDKNLNVIKVERVLGR